MKVLITTLLLFLISEAALASQCNDTSTFWLTRHAHKETDGTKNPPLSKQGVELANKIAEKLKSQPLSAIYSTPYKRTMQTGTPAALHHNIDIHSKYYPAPEMASILKTQHCGQQVLVVGHSNTVPALIAELSNHQITTKITEKQYGDLFKITIDSYGKVSLVNTKLKQ